MQGSNTQGTPTHQQHTRIRALHIHSGSSSRGAGGGAAGMGLIGSSWHAAGCSCSARQRAS